MHQLDAIPMVDNPEEAQSYIISAFDRGLFDQIYKNKGDGENQAIADYDYFNIIPLYYPCFFDLFQHI